MISSTGNSSNAVNLTSLQKSISSLSADKMFKKHAGKSDNDGIGAAKNSTENNGIVKSKSEPADSDQSQNVNDGIIRDDSTSNVSYLKTKTVDGKKDDTMPQIVYGSHKTSEEEYFYDGKVSPPINSFDSLAAEIGAIGDKISKQQLVAYLQTLKTDSSNAGSNSTQIAFVKNILAKFDTLAAGQEYITSLTGLNDPQDYKTVTPEQVTPPFDLRI